MKCPWSPEDDNGSPGTKVYKSSYNHSGLCSPLDLIQSSVHARQAFYQLNYIPSSEMAWSRDKKQSQEKEQSRKSFVQQCKHCAQSYLNVGATGSVGHTVDSPQLILFTYLLHRCIFLRPNDQRMERIWEKSFKLTVSFILEHIIYGIWRINQLTNNWKYVTK